MEALDLPPLWPTSTSGPILLQSEPPLPNLVQNLPELANSLHKNDKANFGQPGSANILSSTNTFVNLFFRDFLSQGVSCSLCFNGFDLCHMIMMMVLMTFISTTRFTHFHAYLPFSRVALQELVWLKLFFLVWHNSWHFEKEPWFWGTFCLLWLWVVVMGGCMEHFPMMGWGCGARVLGWVAEGKHVERRWGCAVQHCYAGP